MDQAQALLIGGRSGVGKTTVGWEVSARLRAAEVSHAIIDGDFMGQVHPAPEGDPDRSRITERNLSAVWANFAALGYRRLIYVNTVCVLPEAAEIFRRAMGADVRMVRVLLTASDATAGRRLVGRELGSELQEGLATSHRKVRLLDARVSSDTLRVPTDERSVGHIAREVVAATGWFGDSSSAHV
jgi:adenylylsulfate kinase-like enzyme